MDPITVPRSHQYFLDAKAVANKHKLNKCRTSKQFCQERFACAISTTEAIFECEECQTLQCDACESLLHETAKFVFHDRKRVTPPPADCLCQMNCDDKNFADVQCADCGVRLCFECDARIHAQGRRKQHKRVPYKDKVLEETENSLSSTVEELHSFSNIPDVASITITEEKFENVITRSNECDEDKLNDSISGSNLQSFLLVDEQEVLQIKSDAEFISKLHCDSTACVKVVSIFGNTGDGKSHTLNHTFFNGKEVFQTAANQASCTIGVWAAFDPVRKAIIIDTEGLLGVTANQNQRARLLLKILAISDIVIYRTRADRIHNDLFQFLGDASKAYLRHFTQELKAAAERCSLNCPISTLGPAVIVFHETTHTEILGSDGKTKVAPEDLLKQRFHELDCSIEAFSAVEYMGTRTVMPPTNFKVFRQKIVSHLKNSSVRSSRQPTIIFQALKVLNDKFSGSIEKTVHSTFPDEYFTCSTCCVSCEERCTNSMNHVKENIPHMSSKRCKYQHQFDNQIFTCKTCYERGQEKIVVPKTSGSKDSAWLGLAKYAWSGYVLECPNCGIIYRSRQYWYGNRDPVETVVRTEISHVWPGGSTVLQGTHNAARRFLDGVHLVSETVTSVSSKPTKMLANWMADQIAPTYWVPNSQITACSICESKFNDTDSKHHCRACGKGFCENCSSKTRPVPERGWGEAAVRVCDTCYENKSDYIADILQDTDQTDLASPEATQVTARKVGEVVQSTFGIVATAIDYPLGLIKNSARPVYWVPDDDVNMCPICNVAFSYKIPKHHCRACGQVVCNDCSPVKRAVPSRGWDYAVRVCTECDKQKADL